MNLQVKLKKLRPDARMPVYQTDGAACCDLTAAGDPVTVEPGARALIPTGLAMDFGNRDYAALIFARSGLASKKGLTLSNGVGVIDADYRGEIKVAVVNLGKEPVEILPGDRIAQMGFFPVARALFEEVSELDETERGDGGFGHTGV
ncbi:MAG: dUTP diphosphatase [Ruminococcaceae bacterium]|jgi:dUTP pyrophosphatase|nr:dUTP diphosphatase [Oscillospiraceae bacterium]